MASVFDVTHDIGHGMAQANGGHLPRHAPKSLPPGVLGLDGWANRLIVVSFCLWVLVAARHAIRLRQQKFANLNA